MYHSRRLQCGHKHKFRSDLIDPNYFKCPTLVRVTLKCGHETIQKPCHVDVNKWKCDLPCDARVEPCGHACTRTCHINDDPDHILYKCIKKCERAYQGCWTNTHKCQKLCYEKCPPCQVLVIKKFPNCSHTQSVKCSTTVTACTKQCRKKISTCGHACKLLCYEPCSGCVQLVTKILPSCGHEVQTKCSKPADIKNCDGACPKILPCGHSCKNKCKEVCTTQCRELVEHTKPVSCGHKFKIECHLVSIDIPKYCNRLLQYCIEPCSAILKCMHKCSGTCGECAQGRIHLPCTQKCGSTLICGNDCVTPCHELCQPCQLECNNRCFHNKCNKSCGEICTKCQEPCTRRCKHLQCKAKCGDFCTVYPCKEPCEELLLCLHRCVGFCGEPCPLLCRICDDQKLSEVFGYKMDAKFVLLDECQHIIESRTMEAYLKQMRSDEIYSIGCPKCSTQLSSTQRYSEYITKLQRKVANMKMEFLGSSEVIQCKRQELQERLDAIKLHQQGRMLSTSPALNIFVNDSNFILQEFYNGRRQRFDLVLARKLESKLTIVKDIVDILEAQKLNTIGSGVSEMTVTKIFSEATSYVENLFERLAKQVKRITDQENQDFVRELNRLQRIAWFVNMAERSSPFSDHRKIRELIYRPVIYTEEYDKIVTVALEKLLLKYMRESAQLANQRRFKMNCAFL